MNNLFIFHSLDETTEFLKVFQEQFQNNYHIIEPSEESIKKNLDLIKFLPEDSNIVFLGHGHSIGFYSPESQNFDKKIIIDTNIGNEIFLNKNILFLSCNSNQYIRKLKGFNKIIGFGNILSSTTEVANEAINFTGVFRNLSKKDIDYFNNCYSFSVITALKKLNLNKIKFNEITTIIEFQINKKINDILLNKSISNRIEISKLLFEFRNEMLLIKNA